MYIKCNCVRAAYEIFQGGKFIENCENYYNYHFDKIIYNLLIKTEGGRRGISN